MAMAVGTITASQARDSRTKSRTRAKQAESDTIPCWWAFREVNKGKGSGLTMRLLADYREFIVGLAVIGLVMTGYYIGKLEKGQR